ncbi:hypothetical protein [Legionella longbeachae]|uniref:Uncharacterized protein n=1 Tax=Legionella longbeachae serogroup 1 (strain NSW150) TaxID=661367 RepID=D3HIY0_LEGLN|nr:hypothetical protein [Legionella longbeachae]VEE02869.1 Uncharacterised protein [Legionella oakridgensis]HBD7398926.1 hypothetical protein [Legionella pneumophila]ARB90888.1 hypothetical protein A6J40_01170 [Legionella longbeachae]ARM32686.1 hypothetical protein B0B39_03775 [Legionella longbeachae]QIN32611.1 hypothetical protein GCB94_10900 [Legionella longbeachae]
MSNQKVASFYSTGGASLGAAFGGVLGSIIAPGVGTAAMAKMCAVAGATAGYALYKIAEVNGYTGYTAVPHMLVDVTIAGIKYCTSSQNQPTNQNTSGMQSTSNMQNTHANQNITDSHARMAALMPRVEQVVVDVMAFSEKRSKKVELEESQKVEQDKSQKVEQDKPQEVEEERRSFGYS